MAYYVDSAFTYGAIVTAVAQNMPPHQVNDILFAYIVINVNTAPTITAGAGTAWSTPVAETTNITNSGYWAWKRAQSATESITLTTTDDYTTNIICIRDVDTTTAIDVSTQSGSASATSTPASVSVTTTTADCFILYLMSLGGVAVAQHANPGVHHIASFDTGGTTDITTTCQGAAWYIQRTAGATPAPSWTGSLSGIYTHATIAFRNISGGIIPPYIDDVSTPANVITPAHHIGTLNNIAYAAALSNTSAINGKTVALAAAAVQSDLGIVPFSNGVAKAAAIAASTTMNGFEVTLTGSRNYSVGLIMGSHIGATPKMGTFGMGSIANGGVVVRIGSSATAWNAYQVAARDAVPTLETRSVWAIQAGFTNSAYGATQGTAVNTAAISYLQFLSNQPLFASNAPLSEVYQVFTQVVAGGTANAPVDSIGMADIGKSFRLPVIQKFGAAGLFSYAPIQIGGGDAVNFQINAGALQFPRRYNTSTKEISFHAADNSVGISYAGKSGDVIKHTNSVITSPTPYYWNINATATSAATWDFTGLVIVNGTVTLRNVTVFNTVTFSGCPSITASDCTLIGCVSSSPPATNDSLITNISTSFNKCTFDTTTVSAGNRLCSVATPAIFTNCSFTGSGSSGHAIRITVPGTYSFTGNTFNNYGANTTTSAAIYNDSGDAVTINITGGGTVPTYRNGTSASTTIVASATVTFTGFPVGTDIVVLTAGTTTVLVAIDQNATTSYAYTYSGTPTIDVGFINQGFIPFYIRGLTLGTVSSSIPVALSIDRNYV